MKLDFQPFDYKNMPDSGMYWIAGTRPVYDIDAGDEGQTVGYPTGAVEEFTALVWLEVHTKPDGSIDGYHFDPVDAGNLGNFCEESTVQYYAEIKKPAHPHATEDKVFYIEGQVVFKRSEESNCVCCPEGQKHVFNHSVKWDSASRGLGFHYSKSADDLVSRLSYQFANEGRRIRLTAELVDDAEPQASNL